MLQAAPRLSLSSRPSRRPRRRPDRNRRFDRHIGVNSSLPNVVENYLDALPLIPIAEPVSVPLARPLPIALSGRLGDGRSRRTANRRGHRPTCCAWPERDDDVPHLLSRLSQHVASIRSSVRSGTSVRRGIARRNGRVLIGNVREGPALLDLALAITTTSRRLAIASSWVCVREMRLFLRSSASGATLPHLGPALLIERGHGSSSISTLGP